MVEERRKSVRIKKTLTVRYSYGIDKGVEKWDITGIRDISETGMSISAQHKFSLNDILEFLIKIPSRPLDWVEFAGRIVGCEELKDIFGKAVGETYIIRVEFVNLKEEQKKIIREYIEWFLAKEKGGQK